MARDLTRIGQLARKDEKARFTSIYHFVTDVDHLRASYEETEKDSAPGIDGVTKEEYGKRLEGNLRELADRLGRLGYKPQPSQTGIYSETWKSRRNTIRDTVFWKTR